MILFLWGKKLDDYELQALIFYAPLCLEDELLRCPF